MCRKLVPKEAVVSVVLRDALLMLQKGGTPGDGKESKKDEKKMMVPVTMLSIQMKGDKFVMVPKMYAIAMSELFQTIAEGYPEDTVYPIVSQDEDSIKYLVRCMNLHQGKKCISFGDDNDAKHGLSCTACIQWVKDNIDAMSKREISNVARAAHYLGMPQTLRCLAKYFWGE
jgi:hypothetical protein